MAKQTKTGKAFEYSLLHEFHSRLKDITTVNIIENHAYLTARECFDAFPSEEKDAYVLSSSFAVNFLIDLEPRLSYGIDNEDILQLEIATDSQGQKGDVRDVIIIRAKQKWEIGISAKNNHRALKHSRLSGKLDFGKSWVGLPCSTTYFDQVNVVFNRLSEIRKHDNTTKWDEVIQDKYQEVYKPILEAFKKEMLALEKQAPDNFAQNLILYLVGNKDFYKVIKGKKKVEIQAFNLMGSLNKSFGKHKPKAKVQKLNLPSRIIELSFKNGYDNTLLATFDEGWQISFRIHSASSRVESSLKFDINLVSAPHTLFVNHLFIK
ncbi:restriction endonuclease (HaeIII) [Galbibacter marinus]|uniref:Restriction endonuclease (HaeIII) n=1 Tax=Galbibacter marinus TaxID=555500 RepID=K2PSN5_9FLAO|nr:HaeIII family restriction endonuclease [Galbibacter marinus]EKF55585.1 restriction endonuclease (HaeIII) [Galbibacter marinus]